MAIFVIALFVGYVGGIRFQLSSAESSAIPPELNSSTLSSEGNSLDQIEKGAEPAKAQKPETSAKEENNHDISMDTSDMPKDAAIPETAAQLPGSSIATQPSEFSVDPETKDPEAEPPINGLEPAIVSTRPLTDDEKATMRQRSMLVGVSMGLVTLGGIVAFLVIV